MNTNPIQCMAIAVVLFIIADMLYGYMESKKLQRKLNEILESINLAKRMEDIVDMLKGLKK